MGIPAEQALPHHSERNPYSNRGDSADSSRNLSDAACTEAATLIESPNTHELGKLMSDPNFVANINFVKQQCDARQSPSTRGYGEHPPAKLK